jgi:hypothetical protein
MDEAMGLCLQIVGPNFRTFMFNQVPGNRGWGLAWTIPSPTIPDGDKIQPILFSVGIKLLLSRSPKVLGVKSPKRTNLGRDWTLDESLPCHPIPLGDQIPSFP